MFLTGYLQPPTAPVQLLGFPFTWFLHVSYRLPFFHLHCFYMFLTGTPFFHWHGFYMFLTGPLFSLTWFLHVSYRPPFFIYMVFKCFLQDPFFHWHGFYMFLTGPLFSLTWFLHVSYKPLFSFTWFLQGYEHNISRLFTAFAWIIYTFLTWFSKAIYMFFTKAYTVKVRKIFYRFLHVLQMIIVDKDNVNHHLQNIYMLY